GGGARLVSLFGTSGRAVHGPVGAPRLILLRGKGPGLAAGLRLQVARRLRDTVRQRVGAGRELALRGRRGGVGSPRGRAVPFPLPGSQIRGVLGERSERALRGGAMEQLLAPLQRF